MCLSNYKKIAFLSVLFLASLVTVASAQDSKTNLVGVSILAEYEPEDIIKPAFGFVFERKLSRRSGIETGLFYKANKWTFSFDVPEPSGGTYWETVEVRESYLNIPILYRFYTKAVTVSVGPVLDVFVGWDEISPDEGQVTSYEVSPSVKFGPLLKVSKPISLGEQLILEPELRFGIVLNGISTAYYGIGVQLKQQLLKKD